MEISTKKLKKLIENKGDYVLIDVREKEELPFGMIPTARNIPTSEFEKAENLDDKAFKEKYGFAKFKKQDRIILYCRTGSRSAPIVDYLNKKGYKAINYKGSVREWSKIDKDVRYYE